jgi:branched-chain amino acid aminotransferase
VRDSLLALAPELGSPSRRADLGRRVAQGREDGSLTEVFACGTAAVIAPVGHAKSRSGDWTIGDGQPGRSRCGCAGAARPAVRPPRGPHGWMHRVGD